MPGFPVLHYLLEFAQIRVDDTIEPSHTLLPPSLPALNLSHHQSFTVSQFFTSGEERIGVSALALVLPMNIQV